MHSAPTVSYPVGRSRFQGQLMGVLLALGGLAGAGWWSVVDTPGWRQGLFFATLILTGMVAVQAWWRSPVVVLAWDGETWRCNGGGVSMVGQVRLHLDLQFCILLCLHSDDAERLWLWTERRTAPAAWLALRRALVSSVTNHIYRPGGEADALLTP